MSEQQHDDVIDGHSLRKRKEGGERRERAFHHPEPGFLREQNATHYNMDHARRGICLVFYFSHFSTNLNLKKRGCAQTDRDNIAITFANLGFDVEDYHNLRTDQLQRVMKEVSAKDHSESDCFVLVFMSHGDFDEESGTQWLFTYDGKILAEDLWTGFTQPACSLAGKPKMFFIQACRGNRADDGVAFVPKQTALLVTQDCLKSFRPQSHRDVLIMWATFSGFYAFRSTLNGVKGSVFIFFLSKVLQEKGSTHDLSSLLLEVSRKVALEYESLSSIDQINAKKQVPVVESTLLRNLCFTPKCLSAPLKEDKNFLQIELAENSSRDSSMM